jgi:hypothetical protein
MENNSSAEIDFDTWSEMARIDPETFESMRRAAIEAVIENAPEANRERLRRLQWRIDQERRLARTPMAACLRISRMMWRAVLGPGGLQDRLGELQGLFHGPGDLPVRRKTPASAQVVVFARHQD